MMDGAVCHAWYKHAHKCHPIVTSLTVEDMNFAASDIKHAEMKMPDPGNVV